MSAVSVLVTGGAGFVGAAIVDALREKHPEWAVSVFDIHIPLVEETRPKVQYFEGDVTSVEDVQRAVELAEPTLVIHTAGLVPRVSERYTRKNYDRFFAVNVGGTHNILTVARDSGVKGLVYTSSCCAVTDDMRYQYPNVDETWPTSDHSLVYGESKAAAEALVLAASSADFPKPFLTTAIRPSVVFGPADYNFIPSVHACIAKRETPFVLGDGSAMWDVTYITNIADAHVLATENLLGPRTAAGHAFFISNKEPIRFRDICKFIWAQWDVYPPFEICIPEWMAEAVGWYVEWVTWITGNPATLSRGSVKDACGVRYCDGSKAERILGYRPRVGLEDGLRISCEAYKRRLEQNAASKGPKPANGNVNGHANGHISAPKLQ